MPLSFRRRQKKERQRQRLFALLAILLVFLLAAVYLYGNRIKVSLQMNKGHAYFTQGNLDQALMAFNKVLAMKANYPQAIDAIGLIYLTQGDLVRAEIKYEQAIKHGLKFSRRFDHSKIGYSYLSRGIYPQAELEFNHALDISPKESDAQLGHGLALHALGRLTEAISAYRQSLSLNPDLKLAQEKLNQARDELDRDFITYIYDRHQTPLARYSVRSQQKKRYYALAQYTSHIIGYTSEEYGQAGLERALAPYLPGNTVTLTIDADWQRAADRAMGWKKGSLVALDPKTGEIKAIINHPFYNPNRIDQDWSRIIKNKNEPLKNRALGGLYKPGSIFKIITSAAAIESELNLDTIFPVNCSGSVRYSQRSFWCWRRHGQIDSLQAALDTSCNIAMAEVAFGLGPDRLYEFSNKFGFGAPITLAFESKMMDISLPIATSLAPMINASRYHLANRSCGLGDDIKITPLHAAMLAATIANQGKMMQPYLIKEIKNIKDDIIGQGKPKVFRTPIKMATAEMIKAFMIDTVAHGIGKKAQVKGFTVAGKTGTTGSSARAGLNGWFISFAPAEDPQVAIAIFVDREGSGKDHAAPIARLFYQEILKPILQK